MKKQILITVSYIAEIDDKLLLGSAEEERKEKLDIPLEKRFPRRMKLHPEISARWECTSTVLLDSKHINSTKCTSCGQWVTDRQAPDYLAGLSFGEYLGDSIYCPECAYILKKRKELHR